MIKYVYVNVNDMENKHNGEFVKIEPELSESILADDVVISFENGENESAYSRGKIGMVTSKTDVKELISISKSLSMLKRELTPIVSDISLKLNKYQVCPEDWRIDSLGEKIIVKIYDCMSDEIETWEFPVSYLYDTSWYLNFKKKENEDKFQKMKDIVDIAIKKDEEEYLEYLKLKAEFAKGEENDKSVCFLKIIGEIGDAIKSGFLHRDPSDKNSILIYRNEGEVCPAGWYSENILEVASDLVNDKEDYERFMSAIADVRKEIEQESKRKIK